MYLQLLEDDTISPYLTDIVENGQQYDEDLLMFQEDVTPDCPSVFRPHILREKVALNVRLPDLSPLENVSYKIFIIVRT